MPHNRKYRLIWAALFFALTQILAAVLLHIWHRIPPLPALFFILLAAVQLCLWGALLFQCQRLQNNDMQALTLSVLADFQDTYAQDAESLPLQNMQLAARMLETQSEIMALQNQINPHFLYNTLETIRGKSLSHGDTEVADMIEVLARLFRYNISRNDEKASLADELENARNCISIHNYRFRNRFRLEESIQEIDAVQEQFFLPILTLQPIVENAIHHGLEPKRGTGTIYIRGFLTESKLVLEVEDNGIGMSDDAVRELRACLQTITASSVSRQRHAQSSGIALINVQRRLQLLFGQAYGLDVISKEHVGTTVRLVLPYPQETEDAHEA